MHGLEVFTVIAVFVIFGCLVGAFTIAYGVFGPYRITNFGHNMRFIPCKRCTAGAQWWNGNHWGPIPVHARMVQDGHPYFEPRQANVRKCPHCQLGGGWRDMGLQASRTDGIESGPDELA